MDFISANIKSQVKAIVTEMMECQETSSCSTLVEPKVADMSREKKAKKSSGRFFLTEQSCSKSDSPLTLKDAVEAELTEYLVNLPLCLWKVLTGSQLRQKDIIQLKSFSSLFV